MDLTKIKTNLETINGGSNSVTLLGVKDWNEYLDGKPTGKKLGFSYEIVLVNGGFDIINVRIAEKTASITQEDIQNADGKLNAEVDGFIGRIYRTQTGFGFSATATSITPV